jgi:hypothetical protein
MHALKIQKKIDSEILYLPEFRNLIGKNVEIIILADYDDTDETDIPNDETLSALAESAEKDKMRRFESTKELFEDLEI